MGFGDPAQGRIVDDSSRVVDVYLGTTATWGSEVTAFDFDAHHAERGR